MRHFEAEIAAYFTRGLSPRVEQRMREHCDTCEQCRGLFRRHVATERALLPEHDQSAQADHLRMGPREAERAAQRMAHWLQAPRRRRRRWTLGIVALVASSAVAAAVLFATPAVEPLRVRMAGQEYQLRGFDGGDGAPHKLGLRLVCVRPEDAPEVEAATRFAIAEVADGGRCGSDDVMVLAWSNLRREDRWLYVLGMSRNAEGALELHDYYPRPGQDRSLPAPADSADQLLGKGIVLGRRHRSGPVTLTTLFTAQALERDRVRGLARAIEAAGEDPTRAESWKSRLSPGDEVLIRHFSVEAP